MIGGRVWDGYDMGWEDDVYGVCMLGGMDVGCVRVVVQNGFLHDCPWHGCDCLRFPTTGKDAKFCVSTISNDWYVMGLKNLAQPEMDD